MLEIKDGFTLTVLGAGVMGTAFVSAILNSDVKPSPGKINLFTPSKSSQQRLKEQYTHDNVSVLATSEEKNVALEKSDVVILACKPYQFQQVCEESPSLNRNAVVLSMLAGTTIAELQKLSPHVARIMTNTPARFGAGMATVAFSKEAESVRDEVLKLADTLGSAVEIPESKMDAATALVGSGPAFCLLMMEALYDGGVRMGLAHDVAITAAAKVMEGTAKMVLETGEHPAALKSKVCTPGGTTIGGLLKLEDGGVRGHISRAVEEAANIAASFAKK